jgi:subtilisin-like proprotein convertase family protein/N-acetylneuraminic acid mutarotase
MQHGIQTVNGFGVPANITDGSPANPGFGYVGGIAIYPIEVRRVVVTDQIWHQNFGDLIGTLTLNGGYPDVLNNHDSFGNPPGPYLMTYDDSGQGDIAGSRLSDGPGSLNSFVGQQGNGVWMLTEVDDSLTQTGSVENFSMTIEPHQDATEGISGTVEPLSWQRDSIDVPPGTTSLTISATNLTDTGQLDLYVKYGSFPTLTDTNEYGPEGLTNGTPPGNSITINSPAPGLYYWGLYNNSSVNPQQFYLIAKLNFGAAPGQVDFTSVGATPILDDAVTYSTINVLEDNATIYSVDVGLRVEHPRISDLVFHLISPDGTRVLLVENRGGTDTNGMGETLAGSNIPLIPLVANYSYLVLTENTNLTTTPIKFAPPPFAASNDLFYLPEQSLDTFAGENAQGLWKLEIQDDRAGASNNATLVSWQLRFNFTTPVSPPPVLPPGLFPTTSLITARAGHTTTLLPNGKVLVAGGETASYGTLSSAELYDPASGTWTPTGSMNNARFLHTATLLTNGQVLVAGGQDNSGPLTNAELYDPATGTWTVTGSMTTPRGRYSATLLTNGLVLVAGGDDEFLAVSNNGVWLSSAELYNPATGKWTPTVSMHNARYLHTATLLPDGKVLVAGGYSPGDIGGIGLTSSAELYDPATGTWTPTGSLNTRRCFQTATLLPNGQVLVAGGRSTNGVALTNAELYDPATEQWTVTGPLNTGRLAHTATLLPNGQVLVVEGSGGVFTNSAIFSSAELYDPATGKWMVASPLNNARTGQTATLLANGKVLVAGGWSDNAPGSGVISSVELYDYAIGTWTATTNLMTTACYLHTATLLTNGLVLVAGGDDGTKILNSAELFDPASGWMGTGSMMTSARYFHTATLLPNGLVLVAGGQGNSGVLTNAELYDPASGWMGTGSMTDARTYHTATLLANGKVLVAGGYGNGSVLSSAELYNPASGGTWTGTGPLKNARTGHTATLLPNGQVLVAGGHNASGVVLSSAELYDPASGQWMNTGSLNIARWFHTATLLPDGQVLVAGGENASGFLSSAELYDPASGTWTATNSMNTPRYIHTATLLPDGKVLVAGGDNASGILSSAELFDPATGTWTLTGSLKNARAAHSATLLPDGQVLVAGGYGNSGVLPSAELFDVGLGFTNSWQPQIATFTSPLNFGVSLKLTGSGFRGVSEGSGGNDYQSSPSDCPVVQLRSVGNEQTLFLLTTNWSANSFVSVPVTVFPSGYALVTVFVNGIPSASSILLIGPMPTAIILTGGQPQTSSIPSGGIVYYSVSVPAASYATNILISATGPVNVWFNQNGLPSGANSPGDFLLITNTPSGTSVLSTNSVPLLVPGQTYYIGVQNINSFTVTSVFEVIFDTTIVGGGFRISGANIKSSGAQLQWNASPDAEFQVEWATSLSQPMVWMTNADIITSSNGTFMFTDPGATNSPMRFYRLIQLP